MKNFFVGIGIMILVIGLAGAIPLEKGKISPEVGSWKVKITPDPVAAAKGEKEGDDVLTFKDGRFHSTGCDSYGFGDAPYKMDGNKWSADTESKTDGKIHWSGDVKGEAISGKMTWTKLDSSTLNYAIQGSRTTEQPQRGKMEK